MGYEPGGPPSRPTQDGGRIRVLVAEDDTMVREALVELIGDEAGIEVVGAAADAQEAVDLAAAQCPDVALLDVRMPHGGGTRAAREIRARSPETRIVALSAYEDRATVLEMLRAGACSYLVKGTEPEEIVATLERVVAGRGVMSTQVTSLVVDELVGLLDGSERLARQLQETERSRGELVQNLSHELLTPTTIIQGTGEILASHGGRLSSEQLEEMTRSVARATTRLKRLVGNVSITARLDGEEGVVHVAPLRLGDVVQRALSELPEAGSRLRLPAEGAGLELELVADPDLAPRAVALLLENALSFSPPEEPVELAVRSEDGALRVEVLDRGPGVSTELREQIFEAFTQADTSTTRAHEGLGLGLYLARRIMDHHGGRVEYAPRDGGGSVFTLVFATGSARGAA